MSIVGRPSVIHSATALATPAEWVTQTASASQNPRSSRDSPRTGIPSGVKEKTPLKPSATREAPSAGSSPTLSCQLGAKSSSVKGSEDGMTGASSKAGRVKGSTGIGRWA